MRVSAWSESASLEAKVGMIGRSGARGRSRIGGRDGTPVGGGVPRARAARC
ncbi:MAG: hypothetical protein SFV24_09175 [Gemmatimonadales bacterium]|nr:hypothetical protein [Gemmatimonadales bacterium]